jgi:CysZ protein
MKFFRGFVAGATYPLRAISVLCQTPRLQGYVLIPILVNLAIGMTLYLGLLIAGFQGIDLLVANLALPSWASGGAVILPVIEWLLRALLGLLLLIATGLLLVQFGVVLGAPWYGMLSEQLELLRTGKLPTAEPMSVKSVLRDIGRSLLYELQKLLLLVSIGIPLFVISFFPPIGSLIASVGGISLSATILCLDFLSPPLERRRLGFKRKLEIVRYALPASGTFGIVCLVLVSIPLVNLLSIPLCVTAGTLFFCDRVSRMPLLEDLPISPHLREAGERDH